MKIKINSTLISQNSIIDISFIDKKLKHFNFNIDLNKNKIILPALYDLFKTGIVTEPLYESFSSKFNMDNFYISILKDDFTKYFGYALLSEPLISSLTEQLKNTKVIEVGAGCGFLASNLLDRGINIVAIDKESSTKSSYGFINKFCDILPDIAEEHLTHNNYENIIMSWPNYSEPFAANILKILKPGQRLYYLGEGLGGCTGDDEFFNLLESKAILNEKLTQSLRKHGLSWQSIHDRWNVYDII